MYVFALENVGLLLLMAVPGFIIAKLKKFDTEQSIKFISVLLLYVCQPFVTFNSFLNTEYKVAVLYNMIACFIFTLVLMTIIALVTNLTMRLFKKADNMRGVFSYAGAFGNIGYLCIPFLQVLAPNNQEVILYASTAIVAFNLLTWTLGNYLITRDLKYISIKKAVLNPQMIAFIIALPLFLFNINFVRYTSLESLKNVIRLFADLVGPLAMTLVGIKLAETKIKDLFIDPKLYVATMFKLIISPITAFLLLLLLSLFMSTRDIQLNLITLAAMPVANNLVMFCSISNIDTKVATRLIMLSTILSVITIPIALELFV